jgi:hypothetical protein
MMMMMFIIMMMMTMLMVMIMVLMFCLMLMMSVRRMILQRDAYLLFLLHNRAPNQPRFVESCESVLVNNIRIDEPGFEFLALSFRASERQRPNVVRMALVFQEKVQQQLPTLLHQFPKMPKIDAINQILKEEFENYNSHRGVASNPKAQVSDALGWTIRNLLTAVAPSSMDAMVEHFNQTKWEESGVAWRSLVTNNGDHLLLSSSYSSFSTSSSSSSSSPSPSSSSSC